MKTVEINIYKFDELSENAKRKAMDYFRESDDNQFYYDELNASVKAAAELFGLEFGREYSDIRTGHIDDNILELKGARLYAYIMNNYYTDLFKPKFIKSVPGQVKYGAFICKQHNYANGPITFIYSKIRIESDSCPLTGVCYDNDVLQPFYDFIKKCNSGTTLEDLFSEMESAIRKVYRDLEEYLYSDEFCRDTIDANDYDFTADGKIY